MQITVNNNQTLLTDLTESECGYREGDVGWGWQLIECYRPRSGRYVRANVAWTESGQYALYEFMIYGY